jgi:molybdopterin converting factor small subunit
MTIRLQLTTRLAELTGFPERTMQIQEGRTLDDALQELERTLAEGPGAGLAPGGRLHPSILVVLDGVACTSGDRTLPLRGGETIRLMLPVAGG